MSSGAVPEKPGPGWLVAQTVSRAQFLPEISRRVGPLGNQQKTAGKHRSDCHPVAQRMFNQATIKGEWFERDLPPAVPRGVLVEVVSAAPIAEVLTNKARKGELMFVKNHRVRLVDQLEALVQAPVAELTVLRRRCAICS